MVYQDCQINATSSNNGCVWRWRLYCQNQAKIIRLSYTARMDEIHHTNRQRWNALAKANIEFSQPFLDYTAEDARRRIGRHGILKDVEGKNVLCLASGGGQDSVAFGLLGAQVTVLDLSDVQLERDRQAAAHHGLSTTTIQGDMRDLTIFADDTFDIVWQVYSINFVPAVEPVFRGVARILRPDGIYFVQFANPFTHSVNEEAWDGNAYPLQHLYLDGEDLLRYYPDWDVKQPDGVKVKLPSPHEFRHTLGPLMNTLVRYGFIFLGLWECSELEEEPLPGSWAHFTRVSPPWFDSFWQLKK
jgi:SAM-dependent methyltransferase